MARLVLSSRRWLAPALLMLCLPARAAPIASDVFADMTLEELSNVRITSVSKKSELLSDAPASVFVITGEDIRRAGVTSLPEALRLAPNLQVARLDARNYAISARGFNNAFANKLLVLIDGRIVYSPLFSGVFWDAQDVVLEDVLRIEVISGPGGTLWGANAVNGVINVITRSAADTQGVLVGMGASRLERQATGQFGGKSADGGYYRLYAKHMENDDTVRADGTSTRTGWRRNQAGLRSDWSDRGRNLTIQGDAYDGSLHQAGTADIGISGANLSAHMNDAMADGSDMSLAAYWDYTHRNQPGAFIENLHTVNVDLQHTLNATGRHSLVWGAGYRLALDQIDNGNTFAFLPASTYLHWGSLFLQDEMALSRDVRLTGGVRLEHNNYTGMEVLPTVRLAWHAAKNGMAWGSVSRSVRTPSRIDRDFYSPSQPAIVGGVPRNITIAGGPDFASEVARVVELGYRGQPTTYLSYSVTVFHARYDRLRTLELSPDGFTSSFANQARGRVQGIETWGNLQASAGWRLSAGLVVQRVRTELAPGSIDVSAQTSLARNDPSHTWMLRSSHDLSNNKELDFTLRGVGALRMPAVPAYTDLSVRLGWKIRRDLEFSIVGQNLLNASHPEFGSAAGRSQIERSVFAKLLWRL